MSQDRDGPLLTLEPLIEAVRAAVEGTGRWSLSGLQKTTSHEFEGRWAGDSTRSAYLFFHGQDETEPVSLDVYLDETSRGLTGNLALVVDLRPLGRLGNVDPLLGRLARAGAPIRGEARRAPLTLRFRLGDAAAEPATAETEVRFKLVISRSAIASGAAAVREEVTGAVSAFERVIVASELEPLMDRD